MNITKEAEEGIKENNNKTSYEEINWEYIERIAKRMNSHKNKYPKNNYKNKIPIGDLEQATLRHLLKMLSPIEGDKETYMDHLDAIGCNAQMIHEQLKNVNKQ